jgi:hypothetical protein
MILHNKSEEFNDLIILTSSYMNLPIDAVRKDYFITMILKNLSDSEYIERTFVDKIMSVKRHAICRTLSGKVRHIYDVVKLFQTEEVQKFLKNDDLLKEIVAMTKDTDSTYLEKRNIPEEYDPVGPYGFELWRDKLNDEIKGTYESLHKALLYSNDKQDFDEAIDVFKIINQILQRIGE